MKKQINYAAVAVSAFLVGFSFHGCGVKYGVSESKGTWMPPGSTDGAFQHNGTLLIIGPPYYRYEYTISETDFVSHLQSMDRVPREIEEPVFVRRYLRRFIRYADYRTEDGPDLKAYDAATGVTISNGLVWDYRHEDASTIYAYDRDSSRAYVEINTR